MSTLLRVSFSDPDWTADDVERLARSIAPRILTMDGLLAVPMINVLRERGIKNVRHKGAR